jgi:hypothetical protein
MAIISIRRYLDAARRDRPNGDAGGQTCLPFCTGLLEALESAGRAGAPDESGPLDQELAEDWARLHSDWSEADHGKDCSSFLDRALEMAARASKIRSAARQKEAADMQAVLAMLNETLLSFASGGDRGVERLRRVQAEVSKAARLDDIVAMRAHLTETTRFIRDEMTRERHETEQVTRTLQDKFGWARSTILKSMPAMAGREEALKALEAAYQDAEAPQLAVVAARLERVRNLSERFSPAVLEDMLLAFAQSAQKDAWHNNIYRWGPATLVWMAPFADGIDVLRAALEERLRAPYEYQTVANGRSVRLSLPIRFMCGVLLEQPAPVLIQQVDWLSSDTVRT